MVTTRHEKKLGMSSGGLRAAAALLNLLHNTASSSSPASSKSRSSRLSRPRPRPRPQARSPSVSTVNAVNSKVYKAKHALEGFVSAVPAGRGFRVRVRWAGYPPSADTMEPKSALQRDLPPALFNKAWANMLRGAGPKA